MNREYTQELMLDFGPDGQTLVPVVTQDYQTKTVLILAYVNREAFTASRETGWATFYSRSRREIWKKGATSGNYLKIREIRINCEQNSLLFLVDPTAKGACHANQPNGDPYFSCYYRRVAADDHLEITN